ncbi:hypothetical protein [Streptomyces dubilierae]|uniref:Uncharacterized protein n=1 Tax=Streptomyces dubilierae TaxID=3075533 RepID=A0ABU2PMJ6_9ACTN|nr:hypothetical protein [Streptomyces sp. DSM 41921]MDT0392928.1 hypothetical protein [Streptomyces sp. DSM 41921]
MFLIVPDPAHGLVAAPESPRDLTPVTTQFLTAQGFAWNDDIQAYTRRTDQSPTAVDRIAGVLRDLGHYVFCAHRPLPTR